MGILIRRRLQYSKAFIYRDTCIRGITELKIAFQITVTIENVRMRKPKGIKLKNHKLSVPTSGGRDSLLQGTTQGARFSWLCTGQAQMGAVHANTKECKCRQNLIQVPVVSARKLEDKNSLSENFVKSSSIVDRTEQ